MREHLKCTVSYQEAKRLYPACIVMQLIDANISSDVFFGTMPNYNKRARINIRVKTSFDNIKLLSEYFNTDISSNALLVTIQNITVKFITSRKRSINSEGKRLADAAELATIHSLTHDIINPVDTKQSLFVENPECFENWKDTFKLTKIAVNSFIDNINDYDIIHDSTDSSAFSDVLSKFLKLSRMRSHCWNPADIYIINKQKYDEIIDIMNAHVNDVDSFNTCIYELYTKKLLFPVSLKQIVSNTPKISFNNVPKLSNTSNYQESDNIVIDKISMSLVNNSQEIGGFSFYNKETNKNIKFQIRAFKFDYAITQIEITSDGSHCGGRIGKVPVSTVDNIMNYYGFERIKRSSFFGTRQDMFSNMTNDKKLMFYDMFVNAYKHPVIVTDKFIDYDEFCSLFRQGNINLMVKLQGLLFIDFFIKNENHISLIINSFLNAAKKIGDKQGFFIKIY